MSFYTIRHATELKTGDRLGQGLKGTQSPQRNLINTTRA